MHKKPFVDLDWLQIQQKLETYATSEYGRQALRNLSPCPHPTAAEKNLSQILEAQQVLQSGRRGFMESLDLFSLWHQRLKKEAILKPLELKDVRHFCLEVVALKEILRPFTTPWLQDMSQRLMEGSEPLSAIDQIMTPEGEIRTDASETLYKLYRERAQLVQAVQQVLDKLVRQNDMDSVLQERYVTTREGRWVLPIKGGMQHHFEGIIHASSQTKQTVFMEPKDVIPLNNKIHQIDVDIEEEIERLLTELSTYLFQKLIPLTEARDILLECDVKFALAQLSVHLEAMPCKFEKNKIYLHNVRHPLLALNQVKVVKNSVALDSEKRILLLSGPNAGGKTVLLKSIGLAAHMARCGLPICADEGSSLPFFEEIHVAVGDSQNIDAHLSTFAAHLKILNESSLASGHQHILLIDEICGSTDPEEGAVLARSFIETYAENQVFAVITSHLGPLKTGWSKASGVVNGSLEYNSATGQPTYQFLMGVPGQSLALQTAKRVGVQEAIIQRALQHLSPHQRKYQSGLEEVEHMKSELHALKENLEEETKEAQKNKAKFMSLVQKFNQEKAQMLHQAVRRAEKKIDQMIEHSKVAHIFQKHEKLEQAKFQLPEIIRAHAKTPSPAPIDSAEDFARAFPPSSKVFVTTLGRDAVVQGLPNARGEVPILSQSMRLLIPWQHLKVPQQATNPTLDVIRKATDIQASPLEGIRVVDLRGLRVEEALHQLENQLDKAMANAEDRIKVIHGHGTESLKRSIRSFLSRSLYVKKWKVGNTDSGGDGITWVEI